MTAKCCRDCVHFEKRGHLQIPWCMGVLLIRIPKDAIDTFYCSEFTRRNSAKKVGQTVEQELGKSQLSPNCEKCGGLKEVSRPNSKYCRACDGRDPETGMPIPPIQRRFT